MLNLLILAVLNLVQSQAPKCRVLVMEGGGDRGAYLAGAFSQMVELMPAQEVNYDVITGISAGGLNAVAISLFERGQEKQAAQFLTSVWSKIKRTDVWETWGTFVDPIWHEPGLLNNAPLQQFLQVLINNQTIKRDIIIGATNVQTGRLKRFNNTDFKTQQDIVDILMTTSAIPALFPPQKYQNETYIDGGASTFMDVTGGIQYCLDKGFRESDIIVDTLMCVGKNGNITNPVPTSTFEGFARLLDLFTQQLVYKDYLEAQNNHKEVNFRLLISPNFFMDYSIMIVLNREQMDSMYKQGQEDVEKALNEQYLKKDRQTYFQIRSKFIV